MYALKRLVIGVTGCIAAYKVAPLIRLLTQAGVEVRVVMTEAAQQFVGAATFQALSGHPVYTDLWDTRVPNQMAHIELAQWADLILIAPATADILAKLAHGHADSLLSTLALARRSPLWVAPAMNQQMWSQAPTQRNIQCLQQDGIRVLGPASGIQACGDEGEGRLLEPEDLYAALEGFGMPAVFLGKKIVMTAGPTFEALDTVRGLTNQSSGKMGFAIAQASVQAGAREVIVVSGPSSCPTPLGVQRISVTHAEEMLAAVKASLHGADFFWGVAAVTDYRPAQRFDHKMKRETQQAFSTEWVANPDILAFVAQGEAPPFCVGFAAESESLLEHATHKRQRKGVPLLVANHVQEAIQSDENSLLLLDDEGTHILERASKKSLARQLVLHAARLAQKQKSVL
jgi:phosphopantothenoylcysteine decarboxylase / phosphopantothenate---cysteine ligase